MADGADRDSVHLVVGRPKLYGPKLVFQGRRVFAFPGVFLALAPVLIVVALVVGIRSPGGWGPPVSASLFLAGLVSAGLGIYFMPLMDSKWAARVAGRLGLLDGPDRGGWVFGLSFRPRSRRWLAWMNAPDDVGVLVLEESALRFRGDSVQLQAPYAAIEGVRTRRSWSGLFVWQGSFQVLVRSGTESVSLDFRECTARTITESRKITGDVLAILRDKVKEARRGG